MELERLSSRPGVPPSHIWLAQLHTDPTLAIAGIAGIQTTVEKFCAVARGVQMHRRVVLNRKGVVVVERVTATTPSEVIVGVAFLGVWPLAMVKDVLVRLAPRADAPIATIAEIYNDSFVDMPERKPFVGDDDDIDAYADMYMQEVRHNLAYARAARLQQD